MIVDGRQIAQEIQEALVQKVEQKGSVTLAIVAVGPSAVTEKYLRIKKSFAETIGVTLRTHMLHETASEEEVTHSITQLNTDPLVHGIVVQLPLPKALATDRILETIDPKKDSDGLHPESPFISPVAQAVREVITRYDVTLQGQNVLVIGQGRLVGRPITEWLRAEGVAVTVVDDTTTDISSLTRRADIIITGAGVPQLITPEMIRGGVVLIDVGTSEREGKIVGDSDPRCASKARVYAPVPGGIGPITVAMLFKNLLHV